MGERLFNKIDTVILTSATLAVAGGFEFTEKRLGLSNARSMVVQGHFDYQKQALLYVPRDLPDRITVDVSQLNIGDSVHVREIQLPSGVTSKVQADLTAFSVLAPTVEEEPAAAEAEAAAAGPELIGEKKEEGEAAASATPAAKEKAPKEKEQKK